MKEDNELDDEKKRKQSANAKKEDKTRRVENRAQLNREPLFSSG